MERRPQPGLALTPWEVSTARADFTAEDLELVDRTSPFTMTSPERMVALAQAVRHLVKVGVEGAFVECGVWRGGSMKIVAETLSAADAVDRDLYLFDTFEGMPTPGEIDIDFNGEAARHLLALRERDEEDFLWAYSPLDAVRKVLADTGYPQERLHFVKGPVESTLPGSAPDQIALLRLDTDFYDSTIHELRCLYPRLSSGGVLIVDDYGHWQGARRAVDEYFATAGPLLCRVDYTGRIAVKP